MRIGGAKKRRDAAEAAIIQALRAYGATVFQLSGAGIPDLLVGYRGTWLPLEVKSAHGTRTPRQTWLDVPLVRTVEDAFTALRENA